MTSSRPEPGRCALLLASALLAACVESPSATPVDAGAEPLPDAPFVFAMQDRLDLDIALTSASGPVETAHVLLWAIDDAGGAAVAWSGFAGTDGHARGRITLPLAVARLEVVVQAPGWQGPYTDESLRTQHGASAPAARVDADAAGLANLVLTMVRP